MICERWKQQDIIKHHVSNFTATEYWQCGINVMQWHLLQSYSSTKAPHTECRVERLCEDSLDSVQKLHAIRDIVKCKCSCCIIHVDPDTRWNWSCDVFALIIVHKWVFGFRAVQTPGLVIPAQAALIAISFTADSPVGNGHVDFCSPPVYLPVTTSPRYAVPAQYLEVIDERLKVLIAAV